jgi:hypothetical protein
MAGFLQRGDYEEGARDGGPEGCTRGRGPHHLGDPAAEQEAANVALASQLESLHERAEAITPSLRNKTLYADAREVRNRAERRLGEPPTTAD